MIECRDKVVHNNILSSAGTKKISSEGTAVSSSSIDEKASAASPTSNSIGKKRKITKSTIASPVGHSKRKRSKNHNNHIDVGSPTNTNGEHNNNNAIKCQIEEISNHHPKLLIAISSNTL